MLPENFIHAIRAIVGQTGLISAPEQMEPYLQETRNFFPSHTPFIVLPRTTLEVSQVVQLCAQAKVGIVPQGGNTGRVGGAVASGEVIINLERMNHIRALDLANHTMTVDSGCILQDIQQHAESNNLLFPLSLGAEGSCQIGGNLSTNAGGVAVLKYGNTRELTLGLEVVLPDGQIWNGLRGLRKNNAGYDLKHLFIGAEGTLGIITGAVLKLFPLPKRYCTTLVALHDLEVLLELLPLVRSSSGDEVTTFEMIPRIALEFACRHIDGVKDPFSAPHPVYALIEFSLADSQQDLPNYLETLLEGALEQGIVTDAVVAWSQAERAQLWKIREAIVAAQKREGASIKNDISVPISKIPELIQRVTEAVQQIDPGIRPYPFGHIGDGNIHFNFSQPPNVDAESFLAQWEPLTTLVNDIVSDLDGSFCAEHGVGKLKRTDLANRIPPVELAMMKHIKQTLDPQGIMNPGKLFLEE